MAGGSLNTKEAREVLKKNKIVIAGVGETEQGKIPDKSSFHFLSQASKLAIEDAGIKKSDVDGLVTAFSLVEHTFMHCTTFADYFGLRPRFFSSVAVGGATAVWMVAEAAMALAREVDVEPLALGRRDPGSLAAVALGLPDPLAQRLGRAAHLARDR